VIRGRADLVQEAARAADDVLAHQRPDGTWPYSEEAAGNWVDGFHTGFVLDGVRSVAEADGGKRYWAALESGTAFYLRRMFGSDGEPHYTSQRDYPLDALSAAQAIESLSGMRPYTAEARTILGRVVQWTLRHMVAADGRVAYRVHRLFTDWRQFPRWSLAPMCSALAGVEQRETA
jgi:hypothetical protein